MAQVLGLHFDPDRSQLSWPFVELTGGWKTLLVCHSTFLINVLKKKQKNVSNLMFNYYTILFWPLEHLVLVSTGVLEPVLQILRMIQKNTGIRMFQTSSSVHCNKEPNSEFAKIISFSYFPFNMRNMLKCQEEVKHLSQCNLNSLVFI